MQKHGGKKIDYFDLFASYDPNANPLGNNTQLDLGKRYFQKSKLHSYLELKELIEKSHHLQEVFADERRLCSLWLAER